MAQELDAVILCGSGYVAMTRARDRLDLGYAGEAAIFVERLLEHVAIAS